MRNSLQPPANFPILSSAEYEGSCEAFVTQWQDVGREAELAISLLSDNYCGKYVEIVRPLTIDEHRSQPHGSPVPAETEVTEEDEVALQVEKPRTGFPRIEYHIIRSPSYQIPVLHFFLRDLPSSDIPLVDRMKDLIIPIAYKAQISEIGVMGGITLAEHPFTGAPVFMIHPCNTVTAMSEVSAGSPIAIEKYLQVWLGIVGGSVGLSLPLDFQEYRRLI